jgi:hypothetical protein
VYGLSYRVHKANSNAPRLRVVAVWSFGPSFEGVIPNPAHFSRVRDLARSLAACTAFLRARSFPAPEKRLRAG